MHIDRNPQMNKKTSVGFNRFTRILQLLLFSCPSTRRIKKTQKRNIKVMSMESDVLDALRGGKFEMHQETLRGWYVAQTDASVFTQEQEENAAVHWTDSEHWPGISTITRAITIITTEFHNISMT